MRNILRKYDVILVDFFDTLVMRKVTAGEVLERWARCIGKKYPSVPLSTVRELPDMRRNIFKKCREELEKTMEATGISEVRYETAIGKLYDQVSQNHDLGEKGAFLNFSRQIDIAVECGCEYANDHLIKDLLKLKNEGKKIYCVSDFYLSSEDLKILMFAAGVPDDLFDGMFVSCDVGKRKAVGDIYPYMINTLGLKPEQMVMLGDNKISDSVNPAKYGIASKLRRHLWYKCSVHWKRRFGRKFAEYQFQEATDDMYRKGMDYSEYIGIFYVFIKRLYTELNTQNTGSIAFMAREGFYLKRLFEEFQTLVIPGGKKIETSYYWCSRRSVMSGIKEAQMPEAMDGEITLRNWLKSLDLTVEDARKFMDVTDEEADELVDLAESKIFRRLMEDGEFSKFFHRTIEENYEAFMAYTRPFVRDGIFRFVDSGWKCTTQNAIQKNYGIKTAGYYIGVQIPDKPIMNLEKTGFIFCEENPRSRYYDYLGTNIPFYQQLLAAPHGTALKYLYDGSRVTVKEEWDPMEKELYENRICRLQEYMFLKFRGMCVWDDKTGFDKKEDWMIAKLSLRSSLFARGSRLKFIRDCTENYVQNFRQENRGKVKYDYRKAKIGIDIIWNPDKYIRYVSKIQRTSVYDHKLVQVFYPFVSMTFYGYVLLIQTVKNIFSDEKG